MEPEITSASAPAGSAPAATAEPGSTEPVVTPAIESTASDRRAKKDAIIKAVRAAQPKTEPAPAPVVETPKPKTEPAPAAVAAPVATLPTVDPRIATLETEAAALRTKLEEAGKVKAAPKDLDGFIDHMEEAGFTMEQISEMWLKRQDNPAHKELTAAEKRLAAIEAKLAEGDRALQEREAKAVADAQAEKGRAEIRGMLDADKARWPRLTRDERNAKEAMSEAEHKAGDKARAIIKAGGAWTEEVAKKLISEALDEIEADRADRATRYSMPDIQARPTIRSTTGNTGTLPTPRPEPGEPKTRDQKKAEILARVRAGQPTKT